MPLRVDDYLAGQIDKALTMAHWDRPRIEGFKARILQSPQLQPDAAFKDALADPPGYVVLGHTMKSEARSDR